MSTPTTTQYDYIIAGGGIAGSVLARRLADKYPSFSVLLVEAGGRPEGHPLIGPPLAVYDAYLSDIDWKYMSVPQKCLGGKPRYQGAAKVLSGGSAINYGIWSRAPACEYDHWAELARDESWGWKGLLPYFIKTETYISGTEPLNPSLHGTSGPISVVGIKASHPDRQYPLRSATSTLFESAGYALNSDVSSGSVKGYCERIENWKNGIRQPASVAYEVAKCTNSNWRTNFRRRILRLKETILCAGAYRSPHLLLLSGIGPASTLSTYGIPLVLDLPDVGKNLHDHPAVPLYWKLKEQGNALDASPDAKLSAPPFRIGLPGDWLAFAHDPAVPAIAKSEGADEVTVMHLSHPERCHTEVFFAYAPAGPGARKFNKDGKTITTWVMVMSPTSRGNVTLASANPIANPVIDPNYYATEADRVALRNGVRKILTMTALNESIFETELTDHAGGADAAIDARMEEYGGGLFHPAGTCAMGKVVDGKCKVVGIDGLRVVDASVIPSPLGAHYQATVYALAEKVADSI